MSLENSLSNLTERATGEVDHLETEEATKNAFVMPFFKALGYNVFDPREFVPEFTADVGKQGEKVDYAILHEGKPMILIECKHVSDALEIKSISQLRRYFSATEVRIGVLTNGITYKFFSDLDESNKMDYRPFLEIDLRSLNERSIAELRRFTKQSFDIEETLEAAAVLKYTRGMKRILNDQLNEPDEEFMRWLVKNVYTGVLNKRARERFTPLVVRAFREFINERINLTLKTALDRETGEADDASTIENGEQDEVEDQDRGIVTTAHEIEGFMIVKAILRPVVDVSRVNMKDAKHWCKIILDNNIRQPICVFYFNSRNWSLGLYDEEKNESKHRIESLDDVYAYSGKVKATTQRYMGIESTTQSPNDADQRPANPSWPDIGLER